MIRKKKKRKASALLMPRGRWTRSPRQKPHSTRHGKKGYDRKRAAKELPGELGELPG